jgi:hypothetical protein
MPLGAGGWRTAAEFPTKQKRLNRFQSSRARSVGGDSGHRFDFHGGPLFVIFQRGNFHQRPFGVCAMHGLAVVS